MVEAARWGLVGASSLPDRRHQLDASRSAARRLSSAFGAGDPDQRDRLRAYRGSSAGRRRHLRLGNTLGRQRLLRRHVAIARALAPAIARGCAVADASAAAAWRGPRRQPGVGRRSASRARGRRVGVRLAAVFLSTCRRRSRLARDARQAAALDGLGTMARAARPRLAAATGTSCSSAPADTVGWTEASPAAPCWRMLGDRCRRGSSRRSGSDRGGRPDDHRRSPSRSQLAAARAS